MSLRKLIHDTGLDIDSLIASERWCMEEVDNFLDGAGVSLLVQWLGARVTLSQSAVDLSISREHLNSLLTNDGWRSKAGLHTYPTTKAELRFRIQDRLGAGHSYQQVADWLTSNWIPTPTGLRQWRRTNIGHYTKMLPDEPHPVPPADCEYWGLFRDWACDNAIAEVASSQSRWVLMTLLRHDEAEGETVRFVGERTISGAARWCERTLRKFLLVDGSVGAVGDELERSDGTAG